MDSLIRRLTIVSAIVAVMACGTAFIVSFDDADAAVEDGSLYKVTFMPNGAEGSQTVWHVLGGNAVELPTSLFSKDGYVLTGWSTSPSGTGSFGSITVDSDKVLYAIWEKPSGDSKTSVPTSGEIGKEYRYTYSEYPVKDSQWALILEGLTGNSSKLKYECPSWMKVECSIGVGKWSISVSGTPTSSGNFTVKIWADRHTESTYWWSINVPSESDLSRSVTFDAGSGEGSYAIESAPAGTAIILPSSGFTREGYTLVAFSTVERGTTVYYPLGSVFTIKTMDSVMTAEYESDKGIMVFDVNGGVSNTNAYIVQTDGIVTLPSSGVTKGGHVLIGWRPSTDPTGVLYAPGYVYRMGPASGSMTMVAVWAPSDTELKTVDFNANGGMGSASGSTASVPSGTDVAVPVVGYTLSGYGLAGWNTERDGSGTHYGLESSVTVDSDMTLYAEWNASSGDGHKVVFILNGGTGSVPSQYVNDGSVASRPSDPSLEFFAFIGWQRVGDKTLWDFSTPITSDTVLRAMWTKMFTLEVSGNEVTVSLTSAFSGRYATVEWEDSSSYTSDKATHTFADGSSGRITVSCDGYTSFAYYSISSTSEPSVPDVPEHDDREDIADYWWVAVVVILILFILRRFA